ncbi:MAG: hypothetical protein JRI25_26655, partial [Deltaproteobacteria bacterium]|nr:hypothetical protein [Deltaproteobacteria bacterium]
QSGAYLAAAIALMHDPALGLDGAWYYAGAPVMGLFDMDEGTGAFDVHPSAWAFLLAGELTGGTLHPVQVCTADGTGCAEPAVAAAAGQPVVAAAVTAGGETRVLLANYSPGALVVEVQLPVVATVEVSRARRSLLSLAGTETSGIRHPTPTEVADAVDEISDTDPEAVGESAISVALVPWEVVLVRVP